MHTAGPWKVVEATQHHGSYVTDEQDRTICDLYVMVGYPKWKPFIGTDATANARLIAASPCLLEALEKAQMLASNHGGECDRDPAAVIDQIHALATAAIARATGAGA